MALTKFQTFVKKLSESQNVKKVIKDLQTLSTDVQKVVKQVNGDDAVKRYKDIMKKVSKREADLEKDLGHEFQWPLKPYFGIQLNL